MTPRLIATYRVRADRSSVEARAKAIAVEQSVEMPVEAISSPDVLSEIVGRVEAIDDRGSGVFDIRVGLATATIGADGGQLLNIAFGNTSLHGDVTLIDLDIPAAMAARFGGPRHGIAGLRTRSGAGQRALACSALKPQGLPPHALASLAERLARGGIDFVKDDHGLADQAFAPFAERVPRCADAMRRAAAATGRATRYVPSLSGDLETMRSQIALARSSGIDTVLISPLIAGFCTVQALIREFSDIAVIAHPSLGGAHIAPEVLIGRLFPLIGADAVIFPNHGGRFGYTPETCLALARAARAAADHLRPALPVPAGGMTLNRVPEMLDFYGPDVMLLIGGSLLSAGARLTEETAAFTRTVASHSYRQTR